ncbi:hypothetical protein ITX31_05930 [Arthrobacter gandavensis]|uniref:hypothetical protein n=1 Tax=Arthrobacter gandavensis TaxID=169960 RepID=UPI0018900779|nr:hypothetical protein [Arthrobacter gandavensis]MBF4993646.1 hypothetical protein [Arthrobacter gandavensis]
MEAPIWAAWIAAGASVLALLGNVALQLWQGKRSADHQAKLQAQQLEFQQAALSQTAESAYMDWLRDKRLDAMIRLQDAFEEVMTVRDLWGFSESRGDNTTEWNRRVNAANNQMASAAYRVRLVFGINLDLLKRCTELAALADKMCRLLLLPWESGQKLSNWESQILRDHRRWRDEFDEKYSVIWTQLHLLTTPLPKSEWEQVRRNLADQEEARH